jgi:hypothetical protein
MIQGPSTYEFHLTFAVPGGSVKDDYNCNWEGEMTKADLTCTVSASGKPWFNGGVETTTLSRDEVQNNTLIAPITIVTAAGNSAPTGSDGPSGGAPQSTSQSVGFAPAGPLPTGTLGFLGGAAAVFVAAVAL